MSWWENLYVSPSPPPWDIGRAQPAIVRVVKNRELKPGKVLDVGCGKGDNAIFLAKSSLQTVGIDLAPAAIRLARKKATEQSIEVDFRVGSVLKLDSLFASGEFDDVIDSGLFHTLSDEERLVFARQLQWVLLRNGNYFMLCFSDKEPGKVGPRRVSKEEIKQTFSSQFRINYIRSTFFADRFHTKGARGYIASATKLS